MQWSVMSLYLSRHAPESPMLQRVPEAASFCILLPSNVFFWMALARASQNGYSELFSPPYLMCKECPDFSVVIY